MSMPVAAIWNDETATFTVARRFQRRAREQFQNGQEYYLEERIARSGASHAQYMASVGEAHANLSDENKEVLKTPEHLRKWALITAGYYDETLVEGGDGEAGKLAAMRMAVLARKFDDFAEVKVVRLPGDDDELKWFMRLRIAKSQSFSAMNKEQFEKSKRDVLDILAGAIEVRRRDLEQAGRSHG